MENVAKRIKELMDSEGLSNSEFANSINVGPAVISHIISGRNKPSLQVISNIKSSFTNVNTDYLISGKGPLYSTFTNVKEADLFPEEPAESTAQASNEEETLAPPQESPASDYTNEKPPMDAPSRGASLPPPSSPPRTDSPDKKPVKSEIERIVIFYSDGSFKSYHP